MKRLMHMLFLSCLKASALVEKKLNFNLSMTERMQLKMHKMMCGACSMYEEQSYIIEKGIELHYGKTLESENVEELKQKIKLNLQL